MGQIVRPLKPHQKMAIMRNIEKMVLEALGSEDEVCGQNKKSKYLKAQSTSNIIKQKRLSAPGSFVEDCTVKGVSGWNPEWIFALKTGNCFTVV